MNAAGGELDPDPRGEPRVEKLSERIAAQIIGDIRTSGVDGVSGLKLPGEAEMSARYGVGRGTLREALRMLEVQGLITIKSGPGGGPVVLGRSPRRLGATAAMHLQIDGVPLGMVADARLRFEPFFARQAAAHASSEDLRQLMALADEASFPGRNETQDLQRAGAFHAAVMECAGNPVLALLGMCLREIWSGSFRGLLYPQWEQSRIRGEHLAIALAIEDGDGDRAERLMQAHMEDFVGFAHQRFQSALDEVVEWR
jgi:GntR family transcriptional regulator, transcriptional repressor for pyruvate dehydrogenase complex